MVPGDASTSLQRTYRYLRLAIAGTVAVVFVAVALTVPAVGLLPSISHYFYTPAATLLVGALLSVSVALFALSGRGAQRVLLDLAATLAPLVAIVPTVIAPGSVPGLEAGCPDGATMCVPAPFVAGVGIGVLTYLIVGVLVVALACGLAAAGRVDRRGTLLSVALAAPVLLAVGLGWWLARDLFLRWAHLAAAVAFFAVIAAVAATGALAPAAADAPRRRRGVSLGIAISLVVVVAGMPLYGGLHVGAVSGVFAGEVAALVLFAAFWVLQSVGYWRADDPALLPRR